MMDLFIKAGGRLALVLTLALPPVCALTAQTNGRSAASTPGCTRLTADYDEVEKTLGSNYARGVGDNSAPRATLRAQEKTNSLLEAGLIVELMQAQRCTLPPRPPIEAAYLGPALACETALLKSDQAAAKAACDRSTWVRAKLAE